jgi:hypothetical protein
LILDDRLNSAVGGPPGFDLRQAIPRVIGAALVHDRGIRRIRCLRRPQTPKLVVRVLPIEAASAVIARFEFVHIIGEIARLFLAAGEAAIAVAVGLGQR